MFLQFKCYVYFVKSVTYVRCSSIELKKKNTPKLSSYNFLGNRSNGVVFTFTATQTPKTWICVY